MNKLHELKDEYAKNCGAADWHDHIKGMSAKDVDEEMSLFCVYLQKIIISNVASTYWYENEYKYIEDKFSAKKSREKINKWETDNQKRFIYE